MLLEEERNLIVEYGKRMSRERLSTGTSGNLSCMNREKGLLAISPSGMDYFHTEPDDVVVTDLEYHIVDGSRKPSSEWALHTEFYRARPDIGGIVHMHSMFCTTFAALGRPIEPVHYEMADAGVVRIPCTPYVEFGTKELAHCAVETCGSGRAVLLGNHGAVILGDDLSSAFALAVNVEFTAELQYRTECIGKPNLLTKEQMETAIEKFRHYGQK